MATQALPKTLIVEDVARLLFMPPARVTRLAKAGKIPCRLSPDGDLLFYEHEIAEWMQTLARPVGDPKGASS
jgi:hypothetical protein